MINNENILINDIASSFPQQPLTPLKKDLDNAFSELLDLKLAIESQFDDGVDQVDSLPHTDPEAYGFMSVAELAIRASIDEVKA